MINGKIVELVEQYYPFTKEQRARWEDIRDRMLELSPEVEQGIREMDRLLSKLGDSHTRIKNLTPNRSIFVIDIYFESDQLMLREHDKSYPIVELNGMTTDQIQQMYQEHYGWEWPFVKRHLIREIKFGEGMFAKPELQVRYTKHGKLVEKMWRQTNISEICTQLSQDQIETLKTVKGISSKQIDESLFYIRISSFFQREIPALFLETLQRMDIRTKRIVLDIRDHQGGYVDVAKELVSYMIDQDIKLDFEAENKEGLREQYVVNSRYQKELEGKKLSLLINENTQSSAEYLFARALKLAHPNLEIIGTETAGLSGQAKEFFIDQKYLLTITTRRYVDVVTKKQVGKGMHPTVIVKDDIHSGKDACMEWIMNHHCSKEVAG